VRGGRWLARGGVRLGEGHLWQHEGRGAGILDGIGGPKKGCAFKADRRFFFLPRWAEGFEPGEGVWRGISPTLGGGGG